MVEVSMDVEAFNDSRTAVGNLVGVVDGQDTGIIQLGSLEVDREKSGVERTATDLQRSAGKSHGRTSRPAMHLDGSSMASYRP